MFPKVTFYFLKTINCLIYMHICFYFALTVAGGPCIGSSFWTDTLTRPLGDLIRFISNKISFGLKTRIKHKPKIWFGVSCVCLVLLLFKFVFFCFDLTVFFPLFGRVYLHLYLTLFSFGDGACHQCWNRKLWINNNVVHFYNR